MWRWLLCGFLVLAVPNLGLGAQEGPKEAIKEDFKKAGKAVGTAAVQVGHAVRKGAKATRRAFQHGGRKRVHSTQPPPSE